MNYAVRITRPAAQLLKLFSSLSLECDRLVAYEHSENVSRIHCHIVIMGWSKTDDTLDNRIKAALNVSKLTDIASKKKSYKPTGEYVSRPVDVGSISYASKGKYDPVYNKGFTDDEITQLKSKGYDVKSKEKEHKKDAESSDVAFYNSFISYEFYEREHLPDDVRSRPMDFYDVKRMAFNFCMKQFKVANVNCLNKYKMIVLTYCFNYAVKVPEKESRFIV